MEDRKVRVLLEDIQSKLKVIHENTVDNPERFGNLEKGMEVVKQDISVIKLSLPNKANVSRVEKIEKVLNIK